MTAITTPGFDYSALSPDKTDTLRQRVASIRSMERSLISGIADIGNHLLAAKCLLDHGAFSRWAAGELSMTVRSAERFMRAATFLHGKRDMVSHLPTTVIYALSAPSAPASVVSEVVAAAEAGTMLAPKVIKNKLDVAIAIERSRKAEAAKTPEQIKKDCDNEKRRRAAQVERERKWKEQREELERRKDEQAKKAVSFLLLHLGAEGMAEFRSMMDGIDWDRVRTFAEAAS